MDDPLTVLKYREVSDGTPSLRPKDKKGAMATVIQGQSYESQQLLCSKVEEHECPTSKEKNK